MRFEARDADDGDTVVVLLHRPLLMLDALDALDAHVNGRDQHATPPDFAGLYELYAASSPGR